MNLLFLLLSVFFTTASPSFTNNEGLIGNNNDGTVTLPDGKRDKMSNSDYIIASDINP